MGWARRNTELGLLLVAVLIVAGADLLASLADSSGSPGTALGAFLWWSVRVPGIGFTFSVPALAVMGSALLAAHIAMRKLAPDADPTLLPIVGVLNGLGYVFIVRIDEAEETPQGLGGQQAIWMTLGIVVFVATLALVRQTRIIERYRYTAGLGGILLLFLPLLPVIGRTINGARIWVGIGPINLQPGEFAKLALAVFFASYLYEKREMLAISRPLGPVSVPDPKYLGPLLLAWGMSMIVMVRQSDLGTALLLFTLFTVLIWVATQRTSYLVISVSLFVSGTWVALSHFRHARQRFDLWNGIGGDLTTPMPNGPEQIDQAAFALGEGGLTGVGLGLGRPDLIPIAESDFIFAAIGEELGLFGAAAILFAFLLIVGTGLRIAQQQTTTGFDRLFAVALTTLIGFQAFIILAGVTQLLPLTGITLPFVSYGGSALLSNYVLVALLLRMSDSSNRQQAEQRAGGELTEAVSL